MTAERSSARWVSGNVSGAEKADNSILRKGSSQQESDDRLAVPWPETPRRSCQGWVPWFKSLGSCSSSGTPETYHRKIQIISICEETWEENTQHGQRRGCKMAGNCSGEEWDALRSLFDYCCLSFAARHKRSVSFLPFFFCSKYSICLNTYIYVIFSYIT